MVILVIQTKTYMSKTIMNDPSETNIGCLARHLWTRLTRYL